ncbi:fungal hydrophobin-domain-containing protein [Infundibulicybe gibba]|nr:fungal hydrophobin-domain-containing protein [Infundibulicybe gibba]
MFARTSTIALFAMLPLLAAATAVPRTTTPTTPASQCNTGDLQCCNSTQESSSTNASLTSLLGLLGVVLSGLTGQVGVTCSPLSVIGVGGNSGECAVSKPVCCSNNSFHGIVAVGCTPVNLEFQNAYEHFTPLFKRAVRQNSSSHTSKSVSNHIEVVGWGYHQFRCEKAYVESPCWLSIIPDSPGANSKSVTT